MRTETHTVTVLTWAELRDLLRAPMAACGLDVDRLYFPVGEWEIIRVASVFNLNVPGNGTLEDFILESRPDKGGAVFNYRLGEYLAILTDEALYGDKALPKTDYRIVSS